MFVPFKLIETLSAARGEYLKEIERVEAKSGVKASRLQSNRRGGEMTSEAAGLREAKTFREMLHSRFANTGDGLKLHDKIETYALIESCGGAVPKVYGRYGRPRSVPFSSLPDRFVLKPNGLAASRGVFVLNKIAGSNGYWDSMSSRRVWVSGIVKELEHWERLYRQRSTRKLYYIAEELVISALGENQIPLDYKFYTFNGEVRFILQVNRNSTPFQYHFYDGEFRSLEVGKDVLPGKQPLRVGEAIVPKRAEEMSAMARSVSSGLKTPFVSVDMFDSSRGPVVGELTPGPGGPYFGGLFLFSESFDQGLADRWREACDELGMEYPRIKNGDKIPKELHLKLPAKL